MEWLTQLLNGIPGANIPDFGWTSLLYVGVFLGVLLAFEGLRQLLSRGEDPRQARSRRLQMIADGASHEEVLALLKPVAQPWALGSMPLIGDLPRMLRQAGWTIRPQVFLTICLGVVILITLAGQARVGLFIAAAFGVALGLLLPIMMVRQKQQARLNLLTTQLPDALELMARGLKVGHPLNTTILSVAQQMSDPIATEFGIVVDQIAYGEDMPSAFADFAERIATEDARYLATSVAIQHGTGGDLARILITLSKVIRGRITMRRKIKAISSEGRVTAMFLSALPIFIPIMSTMTAPSYYWDVAGDPMFRPMAIFVAVMTVVNFLVMRRLVSFRF